jgi:hypothetical protein
LTEFVLDNGKVLAEFLQLFGEGRFDGPAMGRFLEASEEIPLTLPLLGELRDFKAALAGRGTKAENASRTGAKLERRYRKLCCVQESLEKIDFKKIKPGQGFEDFMLGQTDFSFYASLDEETFSGLFIDGLEDYPGLFFTSAFRTDREGIRKLLLESYAARAGKRELAKKNLFILSVMRTLHSSLDFGPLWSKERVLAEFKEVLFFFKEHRIIGVRPLSLLKERGDEVFLCLLSLFHHTEWRHKDGKGTRLFLAPRQEYICLCGTFTPGGKAHSLSLASAGRPWEGFVLPEVKDLSPLPQGPCLRDSSGRLVLAG